MSNVMKLSTKCIEWYRKMFSINELEREPVVQWMFGAMLFYFFVSFGIWVGRSDITAEVARRGGAVCWPYFQQCADWYFLHVLPYGYSQTTLYMCLYAVMVLIVYLMWKKSWVYAHALLFLLLVWKTFVVFVLSYTISGPYDYYHIILTAALLFLPYKEYFLKLIFVLLYFMSVTVKFTPAWIAGTYFTSMVGGAPFLPDWFVPIATNIVIFGQIIECWFLLSKHRLLQRISFAYALFFHLYSGILVLYNYPSISVPAIVILFGPMYRHTPTPFTKKALYGWALVVLIGLFQLLGFIIPTDRYITLEGNRFGMFMFEANHQCVVTVTSYYTSKRSSNNDFEAPDGTQCQGFYCITKRQTTVSATGTVQEIRYESGTAWNRCDPYEWWSRLQQQCPKNPTLTRIALQLDHSINGSPFYRIVDTPNICDEEYRPFAHNPWILIPPEAKEVGYPAQNWYHY